MFANETNEKFGDFEFAISELEKNLQTSEELNNDETNETEENNDKENISENDENDDNFNENNDNKNSIMSVDLKKLIKQELATRIDE